VAELQAGGLQPAMVAVVLGEDPGTQSYLKAQAKAAAAAGIGHRVERLPEDAGQAALHECLERLGVDPSVHGIILQAPLPPGYDLSAAQAMLAPAKDIEGVTPANLGRVLAGDLAQTIIPCTALAAFDLAKEAVPDMRGQEVVVIGASTIVGKPLAQLFLAAEATVRVCHIATRDTAAHAREADIVAIAVGVPGLLKPDWVKPGAVVIDVGINRRRDAQGKMRVVGDADPAIAGIAGAYTPVPGGVGAVTTTVLLENVVTAATRAEQAPQALAGDAVIRLLGPGAADMPPELLQRIGALLSTHLPAGIAEDGLTARLRSGKPLLLDGGVGSLLAATGRSGTHEDLLAIHREFLAAGAQALTAHTFGIDAYMVPDAEVRHERLRAAIRAGRQAAAGNVPVLASLGPFDAITDELLSVAAAQDLVAEVAAVANEAGADGIILETLAGPAVATAALAGVRTVVPASMPVVVSLRADAVRLSDIPDLVAALDAGGAQAVGVNCAHGPAALAPLVAAFVAATKETALAVLALPNAGQPKSAAHGVEFPLNEHWFAERMHDLFLAGATILGGCCGVTPSHIQALSLALPAALPLAPATAAEIRVGEESPQNSGSVDVEMSGAASKLRERLWQSEAGSDELILLASLPGNVPVGTEAALLRDLPGIDGWSLDPIGPGSESGALLAARLAAQPGGVVTLDGFGTPAVAIEQARLATRLGLAGVLIDAGVFAAGGRDPLQLGRAVRQLALGVDPAGNSTGLAANWALGMRLPLSELPRLAAWQNEVGVDFVTLQPIYDAGAFREAMATIAEVAPDLPVLVEVLVLPDAATAAELNNERPAIHVPEALLQRLQQDPDGDRRGVVRFLQHWRQAIAGVMMVLPDGRSAAAAAVVQELTQTPSAPLGD
jgi:methylenetetrahydrofolate dehydrogenase (NADP+)/methenyltetrahydrofolate cyclohydrolase